MASVRGVVVGLWTAWLLGVALPAAAQPGRAALRIDGFDLEQVASLTPGTVLNFSVFATPGASATVLIEGSPRLLALRESEPGVYEGAYRIGAGERIDAQARAVATVWRDGAVARTTLEESLLLDGAPPTARAPLPFPSPQPMSSSAPRPVLSTSLEPMPSSSQQPTPSATYHAAAAVPTPGPARPRAAEPASMPVPLVPTPVDCATCARVESIRPIVNESGAARAGKFAGGVAGALFGEEIGRAHARHVTSLLGALGGHRPGRDGAGREVYEATLRLPDGSQQTRRYEQPPPFRIGDTVRLQVGGADRL